MYLMVIQALGFILIPVIFCPQGNDYEVFKHDIGKIYTWIFNYRGKNNLKTFWFENERKDRNWQNPFLQRLIMLFGDVVFMVALMLIFPANVIDYAFMHLLIISLINVLITIVVLQSGYDNVVSMLWIFFPLIAVLIVVPASGPFRFGEIESFLGAMVFVTWMNFINSFVVLVASCFGKFFGNRWDGFVDTCYLMCLGYHMHIYSAFAVATLQLATQFVLVLVNELFKFVRACTNAGPPRNGSLGASNKLF